MNKLHPDLTQILIPTEKIQTRVSQLAQQISYDYAGVNHLYTIGILKGAFIFLADITRQLSIPHSVDFMAVASYGSGIREHEAVRIMMDLRDPIVDQHVLLIEDIADTGHTLSSLYHMLEGRMPASLRTCVLVQKKRNEALPIPVDYVGFEVPPDVWLVGYGLDYVNTHRTLPYIAELKPEIYRAHSTLPL